MYYCSVEEAVTLARLGFRAEEKKMVAQTSRKQNYI